MVCLSEQVCLEEGFDFNEDKEPDFFDLDLERFEVIGYGRSLGGGWLYINGLILNCQINDDLAEKDSKTIFDILLKLSN